MADLRERIRRKFADGELPVKAPKERWAGYGRGDVCSGCDDVIASTQTEYEYADGAARRTYRFHAGCYAIWLSSVRRAELRRASSRGRARQLRLRVATDAPPTANGTPLRRKRAG